MSVGEYRVSLNIFEGPLDLLLYLVRREELDILDLPISKIINQYCEFIEVLEMIDLDMAGEFVFTASTLTEIKSRLALPQHQEEEEELENEDDDPRSDLVSQLIEYKRFKDAANQLKLRAEIWQDRFPRMSDDRPDDVREKSLDLIKEVELWDLVSALSRVIRKKSLPQAQTIKDDETPVHIYVERLAVKIRAEKKVLFQSLFDKADVRGKITGLFLAVLELVRHHGFRAMQSIDFGEIWLLPPMPEIDESNLKVIDEHDLHEATDTSSTNAGEDKVEHPEE